MPKSGQFPLWGAIAIPAGALWGPVVGAVVGYFSGNIFIGAAIGAGIGIGVGLCLFAAAIVMFSDSEAH
jgi:hypothetical protein